MLGVTEDEMKRSTAYRKMGLSEEDFHKVISIIIGCPKEAIMLTEQNRQTQS